MEEINELAQTEQVDNGEEGVCEAEEAKDERLKMEGMTSIALLPDGSISGHFVHLPHSVCYGIHGTVVILNEITGWAFADSGLHRRAPLWVGARGLEFTWDYIIQGLEANANLMLSLSLAALGSLMWLRKNKPKTLIPIIYACAGIVATMPSITSYLRWELKWHLPEVVGFQMLTSLTMALISVQLFAACQKPSSA